MYILNVDTFQVISWIFSEARRSFCDAAFHGGDPFVEDLGSLDEIVATEMGEIPGKDRLVVAVLGDAAVAAFDQSSIQRDHVYQITHSSFLHKEALPAFELGMFQGGLE